MFSTSEFNRLSLLSLLFLIALTKASCTSRYVSSLIHDIDWKKVQSKAPWYDVIDIPRPQEPVGCWNFNNFTDEGDRLVLTTENFNDKSVEPRTHQFEITRDQKRGIYHLKKNDFVEVFNSFAGSEKKQSTIQQESEDLSSEEVFYLTDYDNFFIAIYKSYNGWTGYVKAKTPQITSNQLQLISDVLTENGLESPVMTLKNLCLRMGNRFNDPAAVIVV
ncbi:uncharacterized protein LOC120327230 [Styela clava]